MKEKRKPADMALDQRPPSSHHSALKGEPCARNQIPRQFKEAGVSSNDRMLLLVVVPDFPKAWPETEII
jgi:hypothetical protein